jgi:putative glutamine amidotransferase
MVIEDLHDPAGKSLVRRLERMVGSRETAEDLHQEALLRAWQRGPREAPPEQQAAWLRRTASNLALDELRRRDRWAWRGLEERDRPDGEEPADRLAVREALARLTPHERFVLLLRFEGGLAHAEIASLLEVSEEAARKRVARARESFAAAWRMLTPDRGPLVLLAERNVDGADGAACERWLTASGARVRRLRPELVERDLATADALVMAGSVIDLHPALYGQSPRVDLNAPDLRGDLADLRALRAALREQLPIVGICRGHQLLNIALGGTLHQDLAADGVTRRSHWGGSHRVETAPDSLARRTLGARPAVASEHHQAVARLGRGVRPTARSPDGVVEAAEVAHGPLVLGLQWHPEQDDSGAAGRRVADALVDAAQRRAA